jgi:hypothetical protein
VAQYSPISVFSRKGAGNHYFRASYVLLHACIIDDIVNYIVRNFLLYIIKNTRRHRKIVRKF